MRAIFVGKLTYIFPHCLCERQNKSLKIEIAVHKLFAQWFSANGKSVHITEMIDKHTLQFSVNIFAMQSKVGKSSFAFIRCDNSINMRLFAFVCYVEYIGCARMTHMCLRPERKLFPSVE